MELEQVRRQIENLPEDERADAWEKFTFSLEKAWQDYAAAAQNRNRRAWTLGPAVGLAVPLAVAAGVFIGQNIRGAEQLESATQLSMEHREAAVSSARNLLVDLGERTGMAEEDLRTLRDLPIEVEAAAFNTEDSTYQPGAQPTNVILSVGMDDGAEFTMSISPSLDPESPGSLDFHHPRSYGYPSEVHAALKNAIDDYRQGQPKVRHTGMGATDLPGRGGVVVARGAISTGKTSVSFRAHRPTSPGKPTL